MLYTHLIDVYMGQHLGLTVVQFTNGILVTRMIIRYSRALHNDILVKDGPHIWQWSHKIII